MEGLSVVIPALNAGSTLKATLAALGDVPVLVVDGGSADATREVARAEGAQVIEAPRGRGSQFAAGVAAAEGDWLLLLHADTQLAPGWQGVAASMMAQGGCRAGYFRFMLDSEDKRARRLERRVAWRSRTLGLPYGDQGLLISRAFLDEIGGIGNLPLMEDVDLVRRIGRKRLVALDAAAVTSAARWRRDGWRRRSLRNLACLMLYFAGVPPRLIVRLYG